MTLLPRGGALVSLPDGSAGVWLGARTEAGRLTADLLIGEAVTARTLDPGEADAGRLVVESESDDVHGLSVALAAMVSAERAARAAAATAELTLRGKETAWQTWKDRLVEAAHERADTHDYCPEFDDFMEDHGLPPRMHGYDVEVTLRVTVVKSARTADGAIDGVEAGDVQDAIDELSWSEYDFTVGSAERR